MGKPNDIKIIKKEKRKKLNELDGMLSLDLEGVLANKISYKYEKIEIKNVVITTIKIVFFNFILYIIYLFNVGKIDLHLKCQLKISPLSRQDVLKHHRNATNL